ncbi:Modulator of FtsH protease HflC [Rhodobacteraceae bacterium THAF1]|uniref:protease modulator HflC n=1 Tax=Palleronia sp. THAF1 TaxID=2587842 RepID=UPI000F3EBB65|nr:protease modulator HflC [Palleronia sp. THAF1]QFU07458.1 Modulator of FtsH protease HflC [Palleronia sp. THAF1]VDC20630.1 Modulator of FtsH protease HflC [Rhodobacteraceae bacterium THAF1]
MRKLYLLLGVLALAIFVGLNSFFVVDERQKALVLQFGQIRDVKEEPGLAFKVPFIQNVVTYDDRILSLDTDPIEVTPSDDRRLIVDAFARYRIADVEQFRRAVGVGGIRSAESRLAAILIAQTRAVLGSDGVTSNTILSEDRSELMTRIRDQSRSRANALGIQVIDVRLKQTALPDQNLAATFERMRAEREREATDERARGEEAAQRVRAQADRTRVELVSEAEREAEITRGEADATRNRIFGDAFGADPEFFEFYRSLTAYERALQGSNSTMVMSPDSEFFNYLKSDSPNGPVTPAPARETASAEGGDGGDTAASGQEAAPAEPEAAPEDDGAAAAEDTAPADDTAPATN